MNLSTHAMTNTWDGLYVKALKEDEYILSINNINQKKIVMVL